MERVIVAFTGEETRRRVLRLLASEGWEAAAACSTGAEVLRTVARLGSAVVVCGFRLGDMTADSLAADLRGLAVLLVVARAPYLELCGGENLYKLPAPISRPEFFAALHMLLDFEAGHLRRPASRRREEDDGLIRRAKEVLMDVNRMSEEEAHRFLRRRAMDCGVKMAEAAWQVLRSYEV